MAKMDESYLALIKEFGTVEVSPSVWDRISLGRWEDGARNGINVVQVGNGTPVAEQAGFEIRPQKFVLMTLVCENDKLIVKSVGIARNDVVPILTPTS